MQALAEQALLSLLAANFPDIPLPARVTRTIAAISQGCRLRRLNRGATLFAQGRVTPALFGVVSGEVEARFIAADGGASVVELMTEGRLFGLASFASQRASTYEAMARRSSQVLAIESAAYDRLMDEVPGFARSLLKELARRHSGTLQLLELARHQSADTRLASALAHVMTGAKAGAPDAAGRQFVRVTQSELAALCGLSRQTVNEILAKWMSEGRVRTDYGGLWVSPLASSIADGYAVTRTATKTSRA
jgi:CRP/FNR family cyclic AMP-dependent transcriptional regulator